MTYSPANTPFLSSRPTTIPPDAILLGAPLDLTESFRTGTNQGPSRIRQVSDCLETYSPTQDRDLEDIVLSDWGDLALDGLKMDQALALIEAEVSRAAKMALPIVLGGEHTISLAVSRALRSCHTNLAVLQLDAHLDLIDEYSGWRISHATWARRLGEEMGWSALVQLGVRSGTRAEYAVAANTLYSSSALAVPPHIFEQLATRPLHLSIDIDVLDPAFAPGTGCPEPGGPSFRDLHALLRSLATLNIVGIDIVEVLPSLDAADLSPLAAAKIVREAALLFVKDIDREPNQVAMHHDDSLARAGAPRGQT